MSILTVENDHWKNPTDSLMGKITYIQNAEKTELRYLYGASVSVLNGFNEMYLVKNAHDQIGMKGFFHITVDPENPVDIPEQILYEAGVLISEYLSHFYGYRQVLMAMHIKEKGRKNHLHFLMNNIDINDGSRLNLDKKKLYELKEDVSYLSKGYGIEPVRRCVLTEDGEYVIVIEDGREEAT